MQPSMTEGNQNNIFLGEDIMMKDRWEDHGNINDLSLNDTANSLLASKSKRSDTMLQSTWEEGKQAELKGDEDIAASCHQSQGTQESEINHEDEKDKVDMVIEDSMLPLPTKEYNMKLVFPKEQNSQKQISKLITNMMDKDNCFMIKVFNHKKSAQYMRLLIAQDIPTEQSEFNQYMVPIWDKQTELDYDLDVRKYTAYSH